MKRRPVTYFHILGISSAATDEQVRESYYNLARQWHPDKHNNKSQRARQAAQKHFQTINHAYIHLKTQPQRDAYLRTIRKILAARKHEKQMKMIQNRHKAQNSKIRVFFVLLKEILWPFAPKNVISQNASNLAVNPMNANEASYV